MGRHRGAALCLAVVCLAILAPSAQAAFPGKNGKIAFTTGSAGSGYQLETIEPDSTGRAALFEGSSPAWSPEGGRLAYTLGSNLLLWRSDIGAVLQLTHHNPSCGQYAQCVSSDNASWAPDGQFLAIVTFYCAYHGGCYHSISTIHEFGGGSIGILGGALNPAWSPDGNRIAFDSYADIAGGIATVTRRGENYIRLSSNPSDTHANWSPDGTKIAFGRTDGIWVMNADGSDQTRITNNPAGGDADPAWSPDGSRIVFVRTQAGQADLYAVNLDGTSGRNLTQTPTVSEFSPDWQPLPGPQRGDYKNAAQFCKAEREFLGEEKFRNRYGGGANAHGKCVSGR